MGGGLKPLFPTPLFLILLFLDSIFYRTLLPSFPIHSISIPSNYTEHFTCCPSALFHSLFLHLPYFPILIFHSFSPSFFFIFSNKKSSFSL